MNICFVALSRKRKRYFDLLAQSAPEDVCVTVVFGVQVSLLLVLALWVSPRNFPSEQIEIHLRRQQSNYPKLFFMPMMRTLYGGAVRWLESVRLKYYQLFFRKHGFDSVAVWNGQKIPYTAISIAADSCGMHIWFFENGVLPGTTTIDPRGVNANSSVSRCPDDYPVQTVSKGRVEAPVKPISILIPLQVESDTQVVLHSPWVKGNADLVDCVISALDAAGIQARLVVRDHPLARRPFSREGLPSNVSVENQEPLSEQLHNADLVVTMNSSVGLEALQLGKPVIVTAAALYGVRDVVKRVGSQVQLEAALAEIFRGDWRPSRAKAFVSSLIQSYCVVGDWRNLGAAQDSHCRRAWLRLTGADLFSHRRNS